MLVFKSLWEQSHSDLFLTLKYLKGEYNATTIRRIKI